MIGAPPQPEQKRHAHVLLVALVIAMLPFQALADESRRPTADAIELGHSRCLKKSSLAKSVATWLGHDEIDSALSISVADAEDGVRFEVRREQSVIGERTLGVDKLACPDVRAVVSLGIASAIDITVLDGLGVTQGALPTIAPVTSPANVPPSEGAKSANDALPISVPVPVPGSPLNPPPVSSLSRPNSAPPSYSPWSPLPFSGRLTLSPGFGPLGNGPPSDARYPEPPALVHRSIPTWSLNADLGVIINVLPKAALVVSPSFEVTALRWLDVRAAVLATSTIQTSITDATGNVRALGNTGFLAGRVDVCAALELGSVTRLRGCAGLLAGGAYASGNSVAHPRSSSGAWISPAIRSDMRWSLTRVLGVALSVDGFFPVLRPRLQIVDPSSQTVATKPFPAAGLAVSLGPSLAF